MKKNKGLWIAVAAGAAIAGAALFLMTTEQGRKLSKDIRVRGKKLVSDAGGFVEKAKSKLVDLKEEMVSE